MLCLPPFELWTFLSVLNAILIITRQILHTYIMTCVNELFGQIIIMSRIILLHQPIHHKININIY